MARQRRRYPIRYVFLLLLAAYGVLFIKMHQLEANMSTDGGPPLFLPTSSNSASNAMPVKIVRDPFGAAKKNLTKQGATPPAKNASIYPEPSYWRHGLEDGNVSQYEHGNLWEYTDLPKWMKDYFGWHKLHRADLEKNPDMWKSSQFYLVECSDSFENCGGTADRLGPLPFHIRVAASIPRLLLIQWTDNRPAPLETFLLPPRGGIDWRMPSWLAEKIPEDSSTRYATFTDKILHFSRNQHVRWVRVKFQAHDHGQEYFDSRRVDAEDPTFAQVFHDTWRIFFTPAPEIANRIEEQMETMGLMPGRYVSTHVRALYAVADREEEIVRWWAQNAVHCTTTKLPIYAPDDPSKGMPILFVSDSTLATEVATEYGTHRGIQVFHRPHKGHQPLHLEKSNSTELSDFFDTFVDIYMIGMGRCTAYSMGGYGRWGRMISYNASCFYRMKAVMDACNFTKQGRRIQMGQELAKPYLPKPLFLPSLPTDAPMDLVQEQENMTGILNLMANEAVFNFSHLAYTMDESIFADPFLYDMYNATKLGVNLWARSNTVPKWMKAYFKWHKQQRRLFLRPANWTSVKLLVMECLHHHEACGGTSDRLKPIPAMLRIASKTNRLLLIHWTRPARLEEFLVPPEGGLDWRVPAWLHPHLIEHGEETIQADDLRYFAQTKATCVRAKFQSYDGGENWYNENVVDGESNYRELYHDLWRVFFTPSPPVARHIKAEMVRKRLVPGKYAAAHVRALYAVKSRPPKQVKRWTYNGLNCASTLRPGAPIFLASDSTFASELGIAYGQQKNASVVTHQSFPNPPLHLDKAENMSDLSAIVRRPISDYYDTFIDLYLLALGGCVYMSKGGYGSWALMIGGNLTCGIKMKVTKKGIYKPCNWTDAPTSMPQLQTQLTEPLFLEPKL